MFDLKVLTKDYWAVCLFNMTINCCLCKKEAIPGDKSRSFHKFPDNSELKQKWMNILGISSVTKYTKLCSDHFNKDAFVDSNGYTTKRRLVSTAIPCVSVASVASKIVTSTKDAMQMDVQMEQSGSGGSAVIDAISTINATLQGNSSDIFKKSIMKVDQPLDSESVSCISIDCTDSLHGNCKNEFGNECSSDMFKKRISKETHCNEPKAIVNRSTPTKIFPVNHNVDVSCSQKLCSNYESNETLVNSGCKASMTNATHAKRRIKNSVLYRSQPFRIDVSHIPPNKKIRFYDGPQVESLSKEDFTSHEAWIKCLKQMPNCAFKKCKNQGPKVQAEKDGTVTYPFPFEEDLKNKCVSIVREQRKEHEWTPKKYSKICSAHFNQEDKYITMKGGTRLKKTALPVILTDVSEKPDSPISQEMIDITDLDYVFDTPVHAAFKAQIRKLTIAKKMLQQKNHNLIKQNKRLKDKLIKIQNVLKDLKGKTFVDQGVSENPADPS